MKFVIVFPAPTHGCPSREQLANHRRTVIVCVLRLKKIFDSSNVCIDVSTVGDFDTSFISLIAFLFQTVSYTQIEQNDSCIHLDMVCK